MKALVLAATLTATITPAQPAAEKGRSEAGAAAENSGLPRGFVYLSDVDPDIAQDIRYAGSGNFTGAQVPGYGAAECVVTTETAEALKRVQARLESSGLTLMMKDCYRPARAVRAFMEWTRKDGQAKDPAYHPSVARRELVVQGYIAARSGHSSGGTVDLTLARRLDDGSAEALDMGSAFDLFDPLSHVASKKIGSEARGNRQHLQTVMKAEGFAGYSREWWHFRYSREQFAGKSFDFEIRPRPAPQPETLTDQSERPDAQVSGNPAARVRARE